MVKKKVLELSSTFKERLSPTELKTLTSLLIDFEHRRIGKAQLIASALLLFKKDEFLHRCLIDYLHDKKSQEDEDDLKNEVCVRNKESTTKTNESEREVEEAMPMEFDSGKLSPSELRKSLHLLLEKKGQEIEDTKGEIHLLRDTKVEQAESNRLATIHHCDPKIGADAEIRVDKMNLEGKKRRILQRDRSPKKTRTSRRLERVTPSYKFILEEEQCPVKYNVLNNKLSLMKFDDVWGHKKLTEYEEVMARCEDDMHEADMLMEALKSAVERAEKVIDEKIRVEDLGVKFYRCIEMVYGGDMFEIVTEDHKQTLPVILVRLKQKLNELTVALEKWKPGWKQVLEETTAKQRESTAQVRRKK